MSSRFVQTDNSLSLESLRIGYEFSPEVAKKMEDYKASLGAKIEKANRDLAEIKYDFKTN